MKRREFLKTAAAAAVSSIFTNCGGLQKQVNPNILFCIADDASYPYMGAYGCSWVKTPAFDSVANNGILFTHAYTPNAKCAPSRACILTGRNSWQLEEAANHWCYFPRKFKTYAEVLAENGYNVGYTGKGWAPGIAGEINGSPRNLTGKAWNEQKMTPPTTGIAGNDYSANFAAFLDGNTKSQPFCFWYGGFEPHRDYEYASGIHKGEKHTAKVDRVPAFWPDNDTVRTDMLDYAFETEYFDRHLKTMLDILEFRGLLDNTLVIVTADNGMPFPRSKGQEYEFSNHMPLAVMWKKGLKNPGRVVDDFVSFIDFAPTLLQLTGTDSQTCGMQPITGRSMTDILFSEKAGHVNAERDHVLIGKERHDVGRPQDQGYPIRGLVTGEYLYVRNFAPERWPAGNPETGYLNCDGSPTKTEVLQSRGINSPVDYWQACFGKRPEQELYHIKNDPECMQNLAENPVYLPLAEKLEAQMFAELKQQGDPRMFGKGSVFDEYPYADQSGVNFYERYQNGEKLNSGWVNASDFENVQE